MKTMRLVILIGLLTLVNLVSGCVIHEHGYYRRSGAHVHCPGCGHELRGGVWVTVPPIEIR